MVSFAVQKGSCFIQSDLLIFGFVAYALGSYLENNHEEPNQGRG